jgi:hypothetical protein
MSECTPADRILQTLRVHVPGVTDELLNLELFNVMDEFFRRTSAWQYKAEIALIENIVEYGFAVPADSVVVRLMGVTHQNIPVPSATATGVVQTSVGTIEPEMVFPDGDISVEPARTDLEGGIFSYAIYRPNYISLTSTPDAEARKYPLEAVLALTLARGCLECDCGDWSIEEWMWDMYFQDFLDGTLGRLYGMPAKPWANPTIAVYHGRRFRSQMAYRKQEALRGFTYNQPAPGWRFPRNGWT